MSKVKDKLIWKLKDKKTVLTRAYFWKIEHNTLEDEIFLKVGRYKKPKDFWENEEVDNLSPKSELTLDGEEFTSLISLLQEHYEPFKEGIKAFIPLDKPFEKSNADQIKALFSLPDKQNLVRFILSNDVIPEELELGLQNAKRIKAIEKFQSMLDNNLVEANWQKWFERNSWVLGSDFVRILDERSIDTKNITDFLMEAYDGFLDIIEIKRPEGGMQFWSKALDHGNYIPSTDLIKAITQATAYIFEIEREANSVKFLERVDGVKTIKPRCILIFGRSYDWNSKQIEAFRILNSSYHNLSIMSYDHIIERAKRIMGYDC
ncbi:MAG: DUF4263 domain-containing protein [Zetaproteobacteria bacterium]|nr:DUF4263 domain-containing protein [Zetaproteobacteria bacterium]